jgi:hypothetical protein
MMKKGEGKKGDKESYYKERWSKTKIKQNITDDSESHKEEVEAEEEDC